MITNDRQHRITRSKAQKFRRSLSRLSENLNPSDALQIAQGDALRSQLHELEQQLSEYEALKSGEKRVISFDSLEQIPQLLIQARTAAGLSQRELADKLGLKEQQIQRYESTRYSSANLDRLLRLARTLGIEVSSDAILSADETLMESVLGRLEAAGLSRSIACKRLLGIFSPDRKGLEYRPGSMGMLLRRLERVFGWSAELLLSRRTLEISPTALAGISFKHPKNTSGKKLAAYVVYANYLALTVLEALDSPTASLPSAPQEFREEIEKSYGDLSLRSTLEFAWDHGIAVLPLSDEGTFHGACWTAADRSVVVLKQKTTSTARWLYDLIHELRHTQQEKEQATHAVIEQAYEYSADEAAEVDANQFAGNVVLHGRAEELANLCVAQARGQIPRLKNAAVRVAQSEGVDLGQLANYLAFRLTLQGENWWGTAANLQDPEGAPWEITRDVLLERLDFNRIAPFDQELIALALERKGE